MAFVVTRKGKSFKQIIKDIETKVAVTTAQGMAVGEVVKDAMVSRINNSIEREPNTGKLEGAITVEYFEDIAGKGWGVGNINKLNSEVVGEDGGIYWMSIDRGGYLPSPTKGSFVREPYAPTQGMSGDRWESGGAFYMKPKKTVEGMNYISEGEGIFFSMMNRISTKGSI